MTVSELIEAPVPKTFDELRIPQGLVHDIVLRQALNDGKTSTVQLSEKTCISPVLIQIVIEDLRDLRYMEVQGLDGRDYQLGLTEAGRAQALDRMALCRYTGPAPVSLADYTRVIAEQTADPRVNLDQLREAFSDLVISDRLLCEVGPAAIAGGAMFLYGPPGTGKSSIAERLLRVYGDYVLVPHAVEVDSQIISVFDPVVHRPHEKQPDDIDRRWLVCKRPFIIVGGELHREMLDLAYQSGSGIYLAPIQMQANNGVLVIDDFGRQADLSPQELLNRWIVPLDRHIDYLTLDYGMKFEVPFDTKIVFSTNLEPKTLGDEAFFRRIQSKILIPTITDDQFEEVLQRVAAQMNVTLTPDAPTHLRWMSRELGDGDLRPYLPGAVCKILHAICTFEERELLLDPPMIERIANMYFTHADDTPEDQLASLATAFMQPGMMMQPGVMQPGMIPFDPRVTAEMQQSAITAAMTASPGARTAAPTSSSIFSSTGPRAEAGPAGGERNWTSAAAKAVAALQGAEGSADEAVDEPLSEADLPPDESGYAE
ncbi:MAG: AAA family ATPase [Actinobacteria bacterium]|nr:AAA family ATPase [Actinomycetota bacterium]